MKVISIIIVSLLCLTSYSQDTKHFDEGIDLFNSENYEKALKSFKKYQRKNDGLTVRFYMAGCYFNMGDFNTSKGRFIDIIDTYTDDIEVGWSMVNLGSCYRELNQIDSAIFYYKSAGEMYPESGAFFNLAQLYYSIEEFTKAKEQYDLAIEQDSTNGHYYIMRQEINFILNDYESALNDMLLARKYDPEYYQAANEAFCHSMMNNYSKADSVFMLIYDDKDPVFLNNFGFNKHKKGSTSEGMKLIKRSIEIEPNNSYAYRNLALIDIDQNYKESACENLNKAKELGYYSRYGNEVNELISKYCE